MQLAFERLGVPFDGIHVPARKRTTDHMTFKTVSLLTFMVLHSSMKQCRSKDAEIQLLCKIAAFGCKAIGGSLVKPEHMLIHISMDLLGYGNCSVCLVIMPNRHVHGMDMLLDKLPCLKALWSQSMQKALLGITKCITSSIEHPTIEDLILFLMQLMVTRQDLMDVFGYSALRSCLTCVGNLLEAYVSEHVVRIKTEPHPLPVLKGKKGKSRNTAPALKLAWMNKNRLAKFHNNVITQALTRDILPAGVQQVFEHASVVAYLNSLKHEYQAVRRVQLSMDESNHTEPTMVSTVYSPQNDLAAYGPIVVVNKATFNDLDLDELRELAAESKLVRMAAFTAIKALHQVLQALGHDFDTYKLPPNVVVRPLQAHETRYQDPETKTWMIHDSATATHTVQVPKGFEWDKLPLLTVCIDQAGTGLACCQFLMEKIGLVMLQFSDKFHRIWNDLKLSFKAASLCIILFLFTCILFPAFPFPPHQCWTVTFTFSFSFHFPCPAFPSLPHPHPSIPFPFIPSFSLPLPCLLSFSLPFYHLPFPSLPFSSLALHFLSIPYPPLPFLCRASAVFIASSPLPSSHRNQKPNAGQSSSTSQWYST